MLNDDPCVRCSLAGIQFRPSVSSDGLGSVETPTEHTQAIPAQMEKLPESTNKVPSAVQRRGALFILQLVQVPGCRDSLPSSVFFFLPSSCYHYRQSCFYFPPHLPESIIVPHPTSYFLLTSWSFGGDKVEQGADLPMGDGM
jgi:hypothetical protein